VSLGRMGSASIALLVSFALGMVALTGT
jgi:hypothetical protein